MADQHLDPESVRTKEELARALSALRAVSGLTVRDIARQVDAPVATVGDYFSGRHLPGIRQLHLFQLVLGACGVTDPVLQERWVEALTRLRLSTDGRAARTRPPFRGLEAFGEDDADLFFGRHAAVEELLGRLRRVQAGAPGGGGAVAVVGPSGSGKTSLFLAGLLPAVRAGALTSDDGEPGTPGTVVAITSEQLTRVAGGPRLVVVDQLEAVLTLPAWRREELLAVLADLQQRALVVLGLRADFYHVAVAEPVLLPALQNQVILGPMTAGELREAVSEPVRRVGAGIEEGLVDLILADLAPGSPPGFAHEPGALPLLSHALLATWERASYNQLTIADYRSVGGLRGAVRQTAEELYGSLTEPEQVQARRMFTRLVRLDDDGPPTRRRATREELTTELAPGGPNLADVLERFISARLVAADTDTVQISHEALLTAWPRLSEWVSSNREWLRLHHQIADATHAWEEGARDDSLLWRGARLETALDLAAINGRSRDLNRDEGEFLSSSTAHRDGEERARRLRTRRTRRLFGAVTVLAVVAVALTAIVIDADLGADRARDQALSREVAIEAQQLQPTDPSLAAQLALAAYRISPTVQAAGTLVDSTAGEIPTRLLGPVGPEFVSATRSGRVLAVAQSATDTVALYRLASSTPAKVAVLRVGSRSYNDFAVAFSPDGKLLAAGGTNRAISLWDVATPSRPVRLATLSGLGGTIYSLAFTPDGTRLAAADSDGTVHRWNLTVPRRPASEALLTVPGMEPVKAVAYSPRGYWLAAAGNSGTLDLWAAGSTVPVVAPGAGGSDFESVDFNPIGTDVAAGIGNDDTVETWSIANGRLQLAKPPFVAATSEVTSTVYSPNGSILAEAAADGSLHLYNTTTWATVATFGDSDPITSLSFAERGRVLVSADAGGVTRLWPIPPPSTYTEPGSVYSLGYTRDGRYLVACSAGPTGTVTIWDDANPLRPTRLVNVTMPAGFGAAAGASAITPAGHLLAVGNATARIQLFNLANIANPTPVGPLLHATEPYIEQLGFSPDGKLLVEGDDSGNLRMWNVTDPARPRGVATIHNSAGEVIGFSFSPDGNLLATASSDAKVRIFDVRRPAHAKLLATLGGFTSYAYDTAFTPNGRTLVAGSAGGTIRMWDVSDPSRPRLLGHPLSIPAGYVYALAVSPDGKTLAAASTAHAVWLWNIADPAHPVLLDTLGAAADEVFAVQFEPNDKVLSASGSDDTVHLWDYQPETAAARVCALSGAPITRAEWARYIQGAPYQPPCS